MVTDAQIRRAKKVRRSQHWDSDFVSFKSHLNLLFLTTFLSPHFLAILSSSLFLLFLLLLPAATAPPSATNLPLVFQGFTGSNLVLSGIANITNEGLLQLTDTTKEALGHGFFPFPLNLTSFFSTYFVIGIIPKYEDTSGHGITFALAPSNTLPGSHPSQHLDLFSNSNVGKATSRIVAVELDTVQTIEFHDIDGNHVGIDINDLRSNVSETASYIDENSQKQNMTLASSQAIQVLVEYDGRNKQMEVTIWPVGVPQPQATLLSTSVDLKSVLAEETFVGFTASNGAGTGSHFILGWSFSLDGRAPPLDLRHLPHLPIPRKKASVLLVISLMLCAVLVVIVLIVGGFMVWRWRRKFAEVVEEWEEQYGPHRFSYRDLYRATAGFREDHVIGSGGFGTVYKGVLPTTRAEVAVKRVSHGSQQGVREFVAEIVSMGRLRHRNLVQLLGYCRRKSELLLIYEYMPNGSLDRYLHFARDQSSPALSWKLRLKIIKGVAAGLFYLHEGWEQVVVHRDIKAGNVLLDGDFNGRLGDFGLARLYDHGANLQTTSLVGTLGYIASEQTTTGRFTTGTDVYAFGAFLLEVSCGRRPKEIGAGEETTLADHVLQCWMRGAIVEAADKKLQGDYIVEEMEMVLRLGLYCSHPEAEERPSMRQVVMMLDGEERMPTELPPERLRASSMAVRRYDNFLMTYPSMSGISEAGSSSSFSTGPPRRGDEELMLLHSMMQR